MNVNPATRFKDIFVGVRSERFFQFDRLSTAVYSILFVGVSIYDYISGAMNIHWYEQVSVYTALAIIFMFILFTDKPNKKRMRAGNLIVLLFNLVLLIGSASFFALTRSLDMSVIMYEFKISMWENSLFGIIIPTLLTEILYLLFDTSKIKTRAFVTLAIILISSAGFGVAHWKVYDADPRILARLGGLGVIFIGLAWLGLPSISVTAHFINNIAVV